MLNSHDLYNYPLNWTAFPQIMPNPLTTFKLNPWIEELIRFDFLGVSFNANNYLQGPSIFNDPWLLNIKHSEINQQHQQLNEIIEQDSTKYQIENSDFYFNSAIRFIQVILFLGILATFFNLAQWAVKTIKQLSEVQKKEKTKKEKNVGQPQSGFRNYVKCLAINSNISDFFDGERPYDQCYDVFDGIRTLGAFLYIMSYEIQTRKGFRRYQIQFQDLFRQIKLFIFHSRDLIVFSSAAVNCFSLLRNLDRQSQTFVVILKKVIIRAIRMLLLYTMLIVFQQHVVPHIFNEKVNPACLDYFDMNCSLHTFEYLKLDLIIQVSVLIVVILLRQLEIFLSIIASGVGIFLLLQNATSILKEEGLTLKLSQIKQNHLLTSFKFPYSDTDIANSESQANTQNQNLSPALQYIQIASTNIYLLAIPFMLGVIISFLTYEFIERHYKNFKKRVTLSLNVLLTLSCYYCGYLLYKDTVSKGVKLLASESDSIDGLYYLASWKFSLLLALSICLVPTWLGQQDLLGSILANPIARHISKCLYSCFIIFMPLMLYQLKHPEVSAYSEFRKQPSMGDWYMTGWYCLYDCILVVKWGMVVHILVEMPIMKLAKQMMGWL